MPNALKHRIGTLHHRGMPLTTVDDHDAMAAGGLPGEIPGNLVYIEPGIGAGLTPLSPIIAADGAPIPATGPGMWDQLVAAGPHM